MKRCRRCGLLLLDSCERCDCGYDGSVAVGRLEMAAYRWKRLWRNGKWTWYVVVIVLLLVPLLIFIGIGLIEAFVWMYL